MPAGTEEIIKAEQCFPGFFAAAVLDVIWIPLVGTTSVRSEVELWDGGYPSAANTTTVAELVRSQ